MKGIFKMKKVIYAEQEIVKKLGIKGWIESIGKGGLEEILDLCKKEIEISRTHQITYNGKKMEREDNREYLKNIIEDSSFISCKEKLDYVICLFLLQSATIGLEELDQAMSIDYIKKLLIDKCKFYKSNGSSVAEAVLSNYEAESFSIIDVAQMIGMMRKEVISKGYVYSIIQGSTRVKKDAYLTKEKVGEKKQQILSDIFQLKSSTYEEMIEELLNSQQSLDEILDCILKYCLNDKKISADYVFCVCPKGTDIIVPETMKGTSDSNSSFVCKLHIKSEIESKLPFPKEKLDKMLNDGMMSTKQKAVDTTFGEGYFTAEYTQKSHDLLIFTEADSVIEMHKCIFMKSAMRSGISLYFEDKGILLPPSYCDLRGVKIKGDFSEDNLIYLIHYSEIVRDIMTNAFKKEIYLK